MNLTEAATSLGVSGRTSRLAVERQETEAEHPLADGPWVINQRALETDAAARTQQSGFSVSPKVPDCHDDLIRAACSGGELLVVRTASPTKGTSFVNVRGSTRLTGQRVEWLNPQRASTHAL